MQFTSRIPVFHKGYSWSEANGSNDDQLCYCKHRGDGYPCDEQDFRYYNPFAEESGLFLEFARAEASQDGIVRFADQFGVLWHDDTGRPGASFYDWRANMDCMRSAVHLWQAIRDKDRTALDCHLRWKRSHLEWISELKKHALGDWQFDSGPWKRPPGTYSPGNTICPAADLLDWVIRQTCSRALSMRPVRNKRAIELRLFVDELRDVLWIQFALAVSGNGQFKNCAECGRPFEVSPSVNRSDKAFCRDACRVKAYRRRIRKAQQMRADGKTLRQIATELGSNFGDC